MSAVLRLSSVGSGLGCAKRTLALSTVSGQKSKFGSDSEAAKTKAVVFDIGGVIVPSSMPFLIEYESTLGLPSGTLTKAVMRGGDNGAWQQMKRGKISPSEFSQKFSQEVASLCGGRQVDVSQMMKRLAEYRCTLRPFPEMLDAIHCLRAEGIKMALLTNNSESRNSGTYQSLDEKLFDVIVESAKVKMRKPESRIYQYTLEKLEVLPQETVFLDDRGENLKAAKQLGFRTIKVTEPSQAIRDLEREVGFQLKGYVAGTTRIPDRLTLSFDQLKQYLNSVLNIHDTGDPIVRYFEHGLSMPTYFVRYANRDMVLRKKPPGKLLPSAHAVDREYLVMKSLKDHGVPTPTLLGFCEDSSVLGTPFYVMKYIHGRIFKDPLLPGLSNKERREIYLAMCDVLAKIHKVNIKEAGLENFGKQGGFVKRNFTRWAKQYEASKTRDIPVMDDLMKWLTEHMPADEACTVIHGDFRLDNLIFHPSKPEVLAIIDWELSTLGDPLVDLANECFAYYINAEKSVLPTLRGVDVRSYGIPTVEELLGRYSQLMDVRGIADKWPFYMAFTCFRSAAMMQGVHMRYSLGQHTGPNVEMAASEVDLFANLGLSIASQMKSPHTRKEMQLSKGNLENADVHSKSSDGRKKFSTLASSSRSVLIEPRRTSSEKKEENSVAMDRRMDYNKFRIIPVNSKSQDRDIPGKLPLSVSALSPRCKDLHRRVRTFITENVLPFEGEYLLWSADPKTKWTVHPKLEQLKAKAKAEGLWNLFLPKDSDPDGKYGAGLTNLEYAFIAEEMGKSVIGSEPFNCSAPDTGNMEVLVRYGTEEQKEKWLRPLLEGKIRSCFSMTEPAVASSDATNIQASIRREGNEYVINGRKWWSSGAMDPRCKIIIFMGKTKSAGAVHQQQSMILVPIDSPGVKILRHLTVLGFDDAPHGHAEILFENVHVPVSNLLLGEGRGFEIAQGRLGPGRIHHCMRTIGMAERALALMANRAQNRVAFGKPLVQQNSIQQDIAKSRIEIEQSRLLVLKAAHMMDTVGNKIAAPEIAMIKASVPDVACKIIDRAIQVHGGAGLSQDTELASMYAHARVLRIADGPDEVHYRSIARMELHSQNQSKL